MKLFQTITKWLRRRGWLANCIHGKTKHDFKITVLGVECEFRKSSMCPTCTEQYLNKFSTLCASCKQPIFPGTPVGQAWHNAPTPFIHLAFDCCPSGSLYCGQWGEGRLFTLHDLYPEKYPAGTSSVTEHVFNTGNIHIGNVD